MTEFSHNFNNYYNFHDEKLTRSINKLINLAKEIIEINQSDKSTPCYDSLTDSIEIKEREFKSKFHQFIVWASLNTNKNDVLTSLVGYIRNISSDNLDKRTIYDASKTIVSTLILLELGEHDVVEELLDKNCNNQILSPHECKEIFIQLRNSKDKSESYLQYILTNYLKQFKNGVNLCDFKSFLDVALDFTGIDYNNNFQKELMSILQSSKKNILKHRLQAIEKLFLELPEDRIPNNYELSIFRNEYLTNELFTDNGENFNLYVRILENNYYNIGKTLPEEIVTNIKQLFNNLRIEDFNEDHVSLLHLIDTPENQKLLLDIKYSLMKKSNGNVKNYHGEPINVTEILFPKTSQCNYKIELGEIYTKQSQRDEFIITLQEACINYINYICNVFGNRFFYENDINRTLFTMIRSGITSNEFNDTLTELSQKDLITYEYMVDYLDLLKETEVIDNNFHDNTCRHIATCLEKKFNQYISEEIKNSEQLGRFLDIIKVFSKLQKENYIIPKNETLESFNQNINTRCKEICESLKYSQTPRITNDLEKYWYSSSSYSLLHTLAMLAEFSRYNKFDFNWINQFFTSDVFSCAVYNLSNCRFIDQYNDEPNEKVIQYILKFCADKPELKENLTKLFKNRNENVRQTIFEGIYQNYIYNNSHRSNHEEVFTQHEENKPSFIPNFDPNIFIFHLLNCKCLNVYQYLHIVNLLIDTDMINKTERGIEQLKMDFELGRWRMDLSNKEIIELISSKINGTYKNN